MDKWGKSARIATGVSGRGRENLVATLWKVDDRATAALMDEFYNNVLEKKAGKLEALRRAQIRILRDYDPSRHKFTSRGLDIPPEEARGSQRASPFYWAAFVLSGDWRVSDIGLECGLDWRGIRPTSAVPHTGFTEQCEEDAMRRFVIATAVVAFVLASSLPACRGKSWRPKVDNEIVCVNLRTGELLWKYKPTKLGDAHFELYKDGLAAYPHYDGSDRSNPIFLDINTGHPIPPFERIRKHLEAKSAVFWRFRKSFSKVAGV